MKLLSKVIVTVGLAFILFGCANTAYQSGRLDARLEGNGTVTKQDLREVKELEDKREQNQYMWDCLGAIIDTILLFKVY